MKNGFIFVLIAGLISTIFNTTVAVAQRKIDLEARWGFISPCSSSRDEVEKRLGDSITKNKNSAFQTYSSKIEKLTVGYSTKKQDQKYCGRPIKVGTVIQFFVYTFDDIKLSELMVDLTKYQRDGSQSPREIFYTNKEKGIGIVTHIVEISKGTKVELVRSVHFDPSK
ncbi:MAG: hypothetical protein ACRD6X_18440 [Pyrinomonadaceae bacterium]